MEELKENEVYDEKENLEDDYISFFEVAKQEYSNLSKYLNDNVFKVSNEGEDLRSNTEHVNEYNFKSFDLLLQYSVLQLAINEGKLIDQVVEIVEGIAIHDSLPQMIESKLPNFQWTSFTSLSREEAYASLAIIYEAIGETIRDFNQKLANYKAVSNDTLESFYDCVKHLLEVIMAAAGEYKEITSDMPCTILDVIKPTTEYYEVQNDSKK